MYIAFLGVGLVLYLRVGFIFSKTWMETECPGVPR